MVTIPEVGPLEARKQILIEKSDLLRSRLKVDCQQLSRPAQFVDRGYSLFRRLRPGLTIAIPLAGFLLTRRQVRGSFKKALKLLTVAKAAQKVFRPPPSRLARFRRER